MSDTLEPCPFCGGEGVVKALEWDSTEACWWVECRRCGGRTDELIAETATPAIKAWNTRAERTCHDEAPIRDFFVCSECHEPIGKWMPRYCPCCGAKVVE